MEGRLKRSFNGKESGDICNAMPPLGLGKNPKSKVPVLCQSPITECSENLEASSTSSKSPRGKTNPQEHTYETSPQRRKHETSLQGHKHETNLQGHKHESSLQGDKHETSLQGHKHEISPHGHKHETHETSLQGHKYETSLQGHRQTTLQGHNQSSPQGHKLIFRRSKSQATIATTTIRPNDNKKQVKRALSLSAIGCDFVQSLRTSFKTSISNSILSWKRHSLRTFGCNVQRAQQTIRHWKEAKNETERKETERKEMPKEPRFASTLSVEAQYATMKGYEDVVYDSLRSSCPEYLPMLRRNITPHTCDGICLLPEKDDKSERAVQAKVEITGIAPLPPCVVLQPIFPKLAPLDKKTFLLILPEVRTELPLKVEPASLKLTSEVAAPMDKINISGHTHSGEFPHLVSTEKQLVMTSRYQKAMDILDNLRENVNVHSSPFSLSPRVKDASKLKQVNDFNSWSYDWNKEFVPKPGRID